MKIICIEEHAIDLEIMRAAQPALRREAPYIGLQSSVARPRHRDRPSAVTMGEAIELGTDLGEGRIRHMDAHGIDVVVEGDGPADGDRGLPHVIAQSDIAHFIAQSCGRDLTRKPVVTHQVGRGRLAVEPVSVSDSDDHRSK